VETLGCLAPNSSMALNRRREEGMALSPAKMELLQKLAGGPQTAIDLVTDQRIRMVQELVAAGYARDFADQRGRRVEVRLRIWGITGAGRAVLEQRDMVEAASRQPSLQFGLKKALQVRRRGFDDQKVGVASKDPSPKKSSSTPTSQAIKKSASEKEEEP
jgi:hypothetical protein